MQNRSDLPLNRDLVNKSKEDRGAVCFKHASMQSLPLVETYYRPPEILSIPTDFCLTRFLKTSAGNRTLGFEDLAKTAIETENEMIAVERKKTTDPYEFQVKVTDSRGGTTHTVTMAESTFQDLTAGKVSREECVEAAFRFLLDREPKESILSRFDITVISRYFPSFERELSGYL